MSVQPAETLGKEDIFTLLLDIKQNKVTLGEDLVKTIDHKLDEVKIELCNNIKVLKTDLDVNPKRIDNLEVEQKSQKLYVSDLKRKIENLEDNRVLSLRGEENVYFNRMNMSNP